MQVVCVCVRAWVRACVRVCVCVSVCGVRARTGTSGEGSTMIMRLLHLIYYNALLFVFYKVI